MSHPDPSKTYDDPLPSAMRDKKKVAKKMKPSPLGRLKAMLADKPTSLAGELEWFKKHGTPTGKTKF